MSEVGQAGLGLLYPIVAASAVLRDGATAMQYKGHSARIEYDDEDGLFFGRIAGLRDGVGFHDDTVEDLRAAFHEAVEDYLETCARIGKAPRKS